jgi:hypothetical protein
LDAFARIGAKLGGSIKVWHWSPLSKGKAGFDVTGPPDETVEASAEASASLGMTFTGTYGVFDDCKKPPPGTHGDLKLGKAKLNFKLNVKLGPLSFDPSYEVPLMDGIAFSF